MKDLLISAIRPLALILALGLAAIPLDAQLQQVSLPTRFGQTKLPKDPLVTEATVGAEATTTGLPLADLTVKDAYLDEHAGMQGVNFLIANTGQQDAGPFEVSIRFLYPESSALDGRWTLYSVDGLKVGEAKWVSASPICCGWSPTEPVVNNSNRFEVVADPRYYRADPFDPYNPAKKIEIKPVIVESNKGNNKLAINKADMRHGVYGGTVKASVNPAIGTIKVQGPILKR